MAGPSSLQAIGQNAAASIQRMTGPQRVTLALAFTATALGVFLVARTAGSTPMSTLYAGLEPEAAASVTAELDAQGVPYELVSGGRIIQVPSDQVNNLRLDLSAKNLPGGDGGWSVLDDQGITASAFDQRVGYQRAMEGELAKTIGAIDGISSAKVHLAIPEHDLIIDDGKQASASVLIVASGSSSVTPMQVDAIVNLVASSIEGLEADQVSVADDSGRVWAAPGEGSAVAGIEGDTQLRAKREFENIMENELRSMLEIVVGPGRAVVNVAADLDFASELTTTESYEPIESDAGSQMMLVETSRDEVYRGNGDGAAEDGELEIELPDDEVDGDAAAADTDPGVSYELNERDRTYAVNKVVTNAEAAVGTVKSLSVAVLLDEEAIDASRVSDIEETVVAAAGIDTARGDTLAVTLMPINEDVKAAIEAANAAALPTGDEAGGGLDLIGLVRTIGTIVVALVVLILGLRYMKRGPRSKVIESIDLNELEAGGAKELQAGVVAEDEDDGRDPPDVKLQSLIANQTDDVAGVLRSWLNESEEVHG